MTYRRFLDHDAATGITEHFIGSDDGGFTIETTQSDAAVRSIVELNKAVVNDNTGWKGDLHHVAHIPLSIMLQLSQQGIMKVSGEVLDEKKFKAWLNDPENSAFRVKRGRV